MKRIFIFYEYFPPAYKSGGITRSISNLSLFLSKYLEVYVFAGSRDLNSKETLPVQTDRWVEYSQNLFVYYAKDKQRRKHLIEELDRIRPEVIYINGLFTPRFSFFPLLLKSKLSFHPRWVVAPRGMLQLGALEVKPLKKRLYLNLMKLLNLFEGVTWHATETQEKEDIAKFGIAKKDIRIASNIPAMTDPANLVLPKKKMEVRLVFLALISPVKNLHELVKILADVPSDYSVSLDIFGPIKDPLYWEQCSSIMDDIPNHIQITYKGQIKPDESHEVLASYHVMSLLTKGENFGHSIFESMYAGTPVLISDKTPWRNLPEAHAGWDMDLGQPNEIREKIMEIASWDEAEYLAWRRGARKFAEKFLQETDFEKQYQELFGF